MAVVTAMTLFTGCGKGNAPALKDLDVEKYVTLGEYMGLEVTLDAIEVDEEDVEDAFNQLYIENFPEEMFVTDRAVVLGDTANIDYVGKKGDVAFSGGTAEDYNLTIGSGTFIPGFEEGLVGVNAGDTVEVELTFPEDYRSEDLAGQDVVFTVTVNYIIPGEMTDEAVTALGLEGVTTADELRQYVYDDLYAQAEQERYDEAEYLLMDTILANCKFNEIPKKVIAKYQDTVKDSIDNTAAAFGVDANTLTNYFYQMDLETCIEYYSEQNAQQNIVLQAIANKEGLNISDEELDAQLLAEAESAGVSTIAEYIGEGSKEDSREEYMNTAVVNFLIENAVISEYND